MAIHSVGILNSYGLSHIYEHTIFDYNSTIFIGVVRWSCKMLNGHLLLRNEETRKDGPRQAELEIVRKTEKDAGKI